MYSSHSGRLFTRYSLIIASVLLWFLGFYSFRHEVSLLQQSGFVHFPYWDDWDTPLGFFHDLETGSSDFLNVLFSQHNESRKVTTKLLGFAIDRFAVFHSDLTIDISYFVRVTTITIACLPVLARMIASPVDWLLRLGVIAFAIHIYAVGPANLINGLWYVQISFFLGLLFAFAALSTLTLTLWWRRSCPHPGKAVAVAAPYLTGLMGFLSIFSFSGNVLLLPCALIVMWLMAPSQSIRSLRSLRSFRSFRSFRTFLQFLMSGPNLIVLACLVFSIAIYFWGYSSPPHHAGMRSNGIDINYVLNFLANYYQFRSTFIFSLVKTSVFLVVFAITGFLAARLLGLMRGELSWPVVHCIGHACFLMGLAILSAIGRGGTSQGALYALSDRYNTISLLFTVLICTYLVYLFADLVSRGGLGDQRVFSFSRSVKSSFVVIALGLLMLNGLRANAAWKPHILNRFSVRQQARECLRSSVRSARMNNGSLTGSTTESCASQLYPNVPEITRRFSGSWCLPPSAFPSQTIRNLCNYFADSSHDNVLH